MSVSTDTRRRARWSRWLLAALLTATRLAHVALPEAFERAIPRWLPRGPQLLNRLATVAELGSATLLVSHETARTGGALAFVTLAGVWIATVQAAVDGGYRGLPGWLGPAVAWIRIPCSCHCCGGRR